MGWEARLWAIKTHTPPSLFLDSGGGPNIRLGSRLNFSNSFKYFSLKNNISMLSVPSSTENMINNHPILIMIRFINNNRVF